MPEILIMQIFRVQTLINIRLLLFAEMCSILPRLLLLLVILSASLSSRRYYTAFFNPLCSSDRNYYLGSDVPTLNALSKDTDDEVQLIGPKLWCQFLSSVPGMFSLISFHANSF